MSEPVIPYRRRTNRWELALWIIGAVLAPVAAVFAGFSVNYLYNPQNDLGTDNLGRTAVEIGLQLVPVVLGTGFLSILLAIFARALRAGAVPPVSSASASPPLEAVQIVQPVPPSSPAPEPTDYALYMRPSDDENNRPERSGPPR